VTLDVGGAALTILPRRAPVGESGPIRGRTLAVYPAAPTDGPEQCPDNAERLRSLLPDGQREIFPGTVEPGARTAMAVLDLGQDEALAIGCALGLTEILFWDGRRAQILPCAS
jgi:hypothetical protein